MNFRSLQLFAASCFCILLSCFNEEDTIHGIPRDHWSSFGDSIDVNQPLISMQEGKNRLAAYEDASGLFLGEIIESCGKLGCWMIVSEENGDTVQVFMKQHEFFIPKDSLEGLTALIQGRAHMDTLSAELHKELLLDSNGTETSGKIQEMNDVLIQFIIEASGILIADVPDGVLKKHQDS
ncbi:MAG: DUF4920 domain-containing protein [Bacteroidetes bacterium]|nr:DUF4920 domain-containing protein [Bacteroidota bacterium]MDA1336614.1 DUF4920 domain-containing protein [Bacteroidota bacterium]